MAGIFQFDAAFERRPDGRGSHDFQYAARGVLYAY